MKSIHLLGAHLLGAACAVVAVSYLQAAPVAAANSKPRSAESVACSKEADAKGLHRKARKSYRKACLKKAKTTGKTGAT